MQDLSDTAKHRGEGANTHNGWSWRGSLVGGARVLRVLCDLAVQNVLFDHLEFTVLERDVAILQGDEDGVSIFALKPLLSLQGRVWSSCIWVQVILEQVRLMGKDKSDKMSYQNNS